jgi:hypothetical protein
MRFKSLALAAVAAVTMTASAQAAPMMQLNIEDVGAAAFQNVGPVAGNVVNFSGTVGGFFIALTAGVSNSPGTGELGTLNITNLSVTNNGAATGTLRLTFLGSGFTLPTGPKLTLSSSASLSTTDTTFLGTVAHYGTVSDLGGSTQNSCSMNIDADESCSAVPAGFTRTGGDYNLTSYTEIVLGAGKTVNTTGSVRVVPEPASMTLVGLSMLGAAFVARRRRS